MNYAACKFVDVANGIGCRTSFFVSGCRRHCSGCFNAEAQDFSFGEAFTPEVEQRILDSLAPNYIEGLTLLGGEPMEPENQAVLLPFLRKVRAAYPEKSIWCYSGFTFEELWEGGVGATEYTQELLSLIDVLVDGPFVQEKKDITLRFRGSSNQRLLDVPASIAEGKAVLWQDEAIYADHSMPKEK